MLADFHAIFLPKYVGLNQAGKTWLNICQAGTRNAEAPESFQLFVTEAISSNKEKFVFSFFGLITWATNECIVWVLWQLQGLREYKAAEATRRELKKAS